MRVVIQRVSRASVVVDSAVVGEIGQGICALCGFGSEDSESVLDPMLQKMSNLRIFPDENGRFDKSLLEIKGELLLVPQFTLYADTRKGRRPEFFSAKAPKEASALFQELCRRAATLGLAKVAQGEFGADMKVELVNDGPVTISLELD